MKIKRDFVYEMEQQNRQRILYLGENQQLEYAQIKRNDEEKRAISIEEGKVIETFENSQGNQFYYFIIDTIKYE